MQQFGILQFLFGRVRGSYLVGHLIDLIYSTYKLQLQVEVLRLQLVPSSSRKFTFTSTSVTIGIAILYTIGIVYYKSIVL